ncbi:MAG: hypothetical protein ACM3N6_06325 [Betaproteobacteria bacterium]
MKRTMHTLAAVALAAGTTAAFAQSGAAAHSPYYRNHQSAPAGAMSAPGAALREDLEGTVITADEAVQLCDRLSNQRQRRDCVSSVADDATARAGERDELRGDTLPDARPDGGDSQPGR